MNPAEVLVDHALTFPWSQMPQAARTAAATFLHDTLCVGVAGARAAHADEPQRLGAGAGNRRAGAKGPTGWCWAAAAFGCPPYRPPSSMLSRCTARSLTASTNLRCCTRWQRWVRR